MRLLISFHKEHPSNAAEHFAAIYETGEGISINAARRKIDMLYERVRVFVEELHVIPRWAVPSIMEPGSVDAFLKFVQPLSVAKPSPKPGIEKQELFWKSFGTAKSVELTKTPQNARSATENII